MIMSNWELISELPQTAGSRIGIHFELLVVVVVFPSSAIVSNTGCLIKKVVCGIFVYLYKDGFRLIIFNIFIIFSVLTVVAQFMAQ